MTRGTWRFVFTCLCDLQGPNGLPPLLVPQFPQEKTVNFFGLGEEGLKFTH